MFRSNLKNYNKLQLNNMTDMDVKIVPQEISDEPGFEHHPLPEGVEAVERKSGEVTTQVKMKFPNFARLVATHSFENVLERNADEEVILSADLLANLANAEPMDNDKRRQMLLVLGGVVLAYAGVSFKTPGKSVEFLGLRIQTTDNHFIPPVLGAVSLVCGVVLLVGFPNRTRLG